MMLLLRTQSEQSCLMVPYKSLATLASINFDCYTIVVGVWILATILLDYISTKNTQWVSLCSLEL